MNSAAQPAPARGGVARWAAWITPIGIAAIGWRYLAEIAQAATDPPLQGHNVWLIVWTIAALIVISTVAIAPKRATVLWGCAIAAAAAAFIVLSGLPAAALIALWLMTVSVLLGDRILNALGLRDSEHLLERFAIALPLGVITLSLATFVLAACGRFKPVWAWSLMVLLSVVEARHAVSLARRIRASRVKAESLPARETGVLLILMGLTMLATLVWAVAPEVEYDSLNYHLAVPRFYLEAGRLIDLPYFFHSYFAHLPDLFFGLGMALHGEMAAKLANFVVGFASTAAVFSLGELVFTRRVALWAAALYCTTPLTGFLSGGTFTDLTVGFFLTAALIALLRWRRSNQYSWIIVCGLLAGSAVGVKLNALGGVAGLGLSILILALRTAQPAAKKLAAPFLFGVLTLVMAVPWYLPAYFYTGNPTFPLFNAVFKSPRTEPINAEMDSRAYGVGTQLNALIELPQRLTFNPRFGTKPGALGVLTLFCVPFGLALVLARRNPEARLLGFIGIVFIVFWVFSFQNSRYYMAVFPIVAVLGAAGVMLLYHSEITERVTRMAMLTLVVAQGALLSIQYRTIPERFPIHLALGLETRDAFLDRAVPGYTAALHINRSILPGQRVLGVDTELVRFYLTPPIDVLSETLLDHPLRAVGGSDSEIASVLDNIGYEYLLMTRQAMQFPKPWHPYNQASFLNRFATLEYEDREVVLYRLKRD